MIFFPECAAAGQFEDEWHCLQCGRNTNTSKVIKTATISMSVHDFDTVVTGIRGIITTEKGYVQNLSDSGTLNDRAITITIKVPTAKFDKSKLLVDSSDALQLVKSLEELKSVWNMYPELHKNTVFFKMKEERKSKLIPATA